MKVLTESQSTTNEGEPKDNASVLYHLCFRSLRQRQSQDGAKGDHLQLEEEHQ